VPVLKDTEYQWTHGPFSGDYDGTYIWGRGSMDDKSTLTSVLGAIELLLETGEFKPTRTVILALGHDEERGGMRGAPALRDWLLEKYGAGSMAMLVDEGGGIVPVWGRAFGMPGTAEKGKYDLNVTVSTRGGHSSVPPRHTGIGLAALLVAALERNPHPMQLKEESPVWGHLQCAARYGPEVPHDLRAAVRKAVGGSKKALKAIPDILFKYFAAPEPGLGNMAAALLGTTQATDMIAGGVKINALPEVVTAFVNHRLDVGSSIKELQARIWDTLLPVAAEVGVALEGFGRTFKPDNAAGTVYLGSPSWSEDLEPAPISPSSPDAPAWKLLAGTSRGVWASRQSVSTDGTLADLDEEDELVMSPFLLTGNTDTRRYWDLTPNIYRWTFISDGQGVSSERVLMLTFRPTRSMSGL
jgi:Gly-Xaa carboxypeptidase